MPRIHVLGNAAVDLCLDVPALGRPGETVVASRASRTPGGKGLNQAVVAARSGIATRFCFPLGQDDDAALIEAALAREPLLRCEVLRKDRASDLSIVVVAADGENSIVSLCGCADAVTATEAADFAGATAPEDWLLLQGNLSQDASVAASLSSRGRVILNIAPIRWPAEPLLAHCAVVVANRLEAEQVTGLRDPGDAASWFVVRGCAASVITLGADGCVWATLGQTGHLPSLVVASVDTTGAGDTFCGVLTSSLARNADLPVAISVAQKAASLSVTRHGGFAALPTQAELSQL